MMIEQENLNPEVTTKPESVVITTEPPYSEKVTLILEHFHFFGIASLIYGILLCICLYKNTSAITMPIFMVITLTYFILALNKLEIPLQKTVWFYSISIMLLGISNFLTNSTPLIIFNYIGIYCLLMSFLLSHFCNTTQWKLGTYLSIIILTFFGSIGSLNYLFKGTSMFISKNKDKKNPTIKYIWIGLLVSLPLLAIVIRLLVSADIVFNSMLTTLFSNISISADFFGVLFFLAVGCLGSYSLLIYLSKGSITEETPDKRNMEPVIAITFTSVLTAVYLVFCFIQIIYLFIGTMNLPENYTYAEYARQGFFQLLFVCLINLILVLFCLSHFREHKALKIILTLLSCCTYIMIISSAYRMLLYVNVYYLTFLRVFVLWSLLVIGLVLTGTIISIYKTEFPLFQFSMAVVTVLYILFSLSKPDFYIAKYNIAAAERSFEEAGSVRHLDYRYLYSLSTDATPALEEAGYLIDIDDASTDYNYYYSKILDMANKETPRNFNLSRHRAIKIIKKHELNLY